MGFNCVNCFIVRHIGAQFTMEIYGLMLSLLWKYMGLCSVYYGNTWAYARFTMEIHGLMLGLLWKYMGLCSVLVLLIRITHAPRAQVKIIFYKY